MRYGLGIDLGKQRDYAAFALIERVEKTIDPNFPTVNSRPIRTKKIRVVSELHLKYLARIPLKTRYSKICENAKAIINNPDYVGDISLVVDRTGVGDAVMDMMYLYDLPPIGISITNGSKVNSTKEGYNVPKREIATSLVSAYQTQRFKMPPPSKLPIIETFVEELQGFKMKIDKETGHDSYEAWLEKIHDDLVMAVGILVWWFDKTFGTETLIDRPGY